MGEFQDIFLSEFDFAMLKNAPPPPHYEYYETFKK